MYSFLLHTFCSLPLKNLFKDWTGDCITTPSESLLQAQFPKLTVVFHQSQGACTLQHSLCQLSLSKPKLSVQSYLCIIIIGPFVISQFQFSKRDLLPHPVCSSIRRFRMNINLVACLEKGRREEDQKRVCFLNFFLLCYSDLDTSWIRPHSKNKMKTRLHQGAQYGTKATLMFTFKDILCSSLGFQRAKFMAGSMIILGACYQGAAALFIFQPAGGKSGDPHSPSHHPFALLIQ